jgi:hypothetical protein
VVEYLWLKFLWDELTRKEMELFLSMSETVKSELKYAALRATTILGKRHVRQRILECPFLPGPSPSRERYQGYLSSLDVEIHDFTRRLPKVTKYSGYVKSSSAVGSKRPPGSSFLDPLIIIDYDYTEISFDWYNYLTVGDHNRLFPVGIDNHPEET